MEYVGKEMEMKASWNVCLLLVAALLASVAWGAADKPAPIRAPVSWLDWLAEEVDFVLKEAEEPDPAQAAAETSAELERLRFEVHEMRAEIRALRASIDYHLQDAASRLQNENAALRAELQRIYALQREAPEAVFPAVPRPSDDLVSEVLSETVERMIEEGAAVAPATNEGADGVEGTEVAVPTEPVAFSHEIISEWGRDPDQAEVQSGQVSSLKGMVCLVPPRSRKEDVVQLGRDLRRKYDAYDNINIEVFDEPHAARSFAQTNISSGPEHRVLSVSKHKGSGRDNIVYFDGGVAQQVSPE